MNFSKAYDTFNPQKIMDTIESATEQNIKLVLEKERLNFNDFLCLLSPTAEKYLKPMALRAKDLTKRHFGQVIQFYVPLYLSNECDNYCLYCGFSKDVDAPKQTLSLFEIEEELKFLRKLGFQNILLLSGESRHKAGIDYIEQAIKIARNYFTYVSLEIFPAQIEHYKKFVTAGASGLTIYQETYHKNTYAEVHPQGAKRDFGFRIDTPERAFKAGFRKIGIGSLLGLYNWKYEAAFLGIHAEYLMKKYWRSELTISFPRLRDMGKKFFTQYSVEDINLVQMILALRLFLPRTGFILSTRESPKLRDNLIDIGITQISAESKTTPGGYKKQSNSKAQFSVADTRSLETLKKMVKGKGYDPVLKDWAYDFAGIERNY